MIKLPRLRTSAEDFLVLPMTADHTPAAAEIHAGGFANAWTDGDINQLLLKNGIVGFVARRANNPSAKVEAFVLMRIAADEAEILTIAVSKPWRRHGLGRHLMIEVLRHLHAERIGSLFLEVSEANGPAIALYKRLGFKHVAARPDYYQTKSGNRESAIVMRCDLT